jgi:hypothetical protein
MSSRQLPATFLCKVGCISLTTRSIIFIFDQELFKRMRIPITLCCLLFGPPVGDVATILLGLLGLFILLWMLSVASGWISERIWKGKARMKNALTDFEAIMSMALPRLLAISETDSSVRRGPEKWSKKEILGHLIDSASNNHQRFVRAQLSSEIKWPGYEQTEWVRTQGYQRESWESLVALWKAYNLHLLHVAAAIPPDRLSTLCFIGDDEPVTLEFIVADYVRHLKHHIEQIIA